MALNPACSPNRTRTKQGDFTMADETEKTEQTEEVKVGGLDVYKPACYRCWVQRVNQ